MVDPKPDTFAAIVDDMPEDDWSPSESLAFTRRLLTKLAAGEAADARVQDSLAETLRDLDAGNISFEEAFATGARAVLGGPKAAATLDPSDSTSWRVLKETLGAREGETVVAAAARVVDERDDFDEALRITRETMDRVVRESDEARASLAAMTKELATMRASRDALEARAAEAEARGRDAERRRWVDGDGSALRTARYERGKADGIAEERARWLNSEPFATHLAERVMAGVEEEREATAAHVGALANERRWVPAGGEGVGAGHPRARGEAVSALRAT